MTQRRISSEDIAAFGSFLHREEKSSASVEKYLRDVTAFMNFTEDRPVSKELTVLWKSSLMERGYAGRSVNSMLASLNSFLGFMKLDNCKVKNIRLQRRIYCPEDKELTKTEYMRLLEAAKGRRSLRLIIQTICSTGIRVSELSYFTVEAVRLGEISVRCKSKTRTVLVPRKLKKLLLEHAKNQNIASGCIFVNRNGKPLHRSSIWARMKKLCAAAGVEPGKVFPHNLRKLFARTFYEIEKDIAKLADILGHGSIETTRIYIMSTGIEHRRKMERLGLVV